MLTSDLLVSDRSRFLIVIKIECSLVLRAPRALAPTRDALVLTRSLPAARPFASYANYYACYAIHFHIHCVLLGLICIALHLHCSASSCSVAREELLPSADASMHSFARPCGCLAGPSHTPCLAARLRGRRVESPVLCLCVARRWYCYFEASPPNWRALLVVQYLAHMRNCGSGSSSLSALVLRTPHSALRSPHSYSYSLAHMVRNPFHFSSPLLFYLSHRSGASPTPLLLVALRCPFSSSSRPTRHAAPRRRSAFSSPSSLCSSRLVSLRCELNDFCLLATRIVSSCDPLGIDPLVLRATFVLIARLSRALEHSIMFTVQC